MKYHIEASSQKEAEEIAKDMVDNDWDELSNNADDWEIDNEGSGKQELFDD
jgi:hypothetical protein